MEMLLYGWYPLCMRKTLLIAWWTLLAALLPCLLAGCMVEQSLTLNPNSSGHWSIRGEAMNFAKDAMDDLAVLGGYDDAGALYDEAIINSKALIAKRDDIDSYHIERSDAHGWKADIEFRNLISMLGGSDSGSIAEILSDEKSVTLILRFNRKKAENLKVLFPLMSNPAFSLFDPASTVGIDEETYITDILGFTFGEDNIPAMRKASIGMNLILPGAVIRVIGGKKSGTNSVRFQAPLTQFLVPEKEILWSVIWSKDS